MQTYLKELVHPRKFKKKSIVATEIFNNVVDRNELIIKHSCDNSIKFREPRFAQNKRLYGRFNRIDPNSSVSVSEGFYAKAAIS